MLYVLGLSFKKSSTDCRWQLPLNFSCGSCGFCPVLFEADLLCSQMASVAEFIPFSPDHGGMEQGLLPEIPSCNPASLQ